MDASTVMLGSLPYSFSTENWRVGKRCRSERCPKVGMDHRQNVRNDGTVKCGEASKYSLPYRGGKNAPNP